MQFASSPLSEAERKFAPESNTMNYLKTLLILLALTATAAAQDFRFEQQWNVQFWYYESLPYNDYGYGYRPYFPMRRQQYVPPMQYVPMYWGTIPGYQIMGSGTNGYFVPNAYGW